MGAHPGPVADSFARTRKGPGPAPRGNQARALVVGQSQAVGCTRLMIAAQSSCTRSGASAAFTYPVRQ